MSYVITPLGIYRMGQVSGNISSSVTVTYKGQSEVRGCFLYPLFSHFISPRPFAFRFFSSPRSLLHSALTPSHHHGIRFAFSF
jgi:hypothetical protein